MGTRLGGALGTSLAIHATILLALLLTIGAGPATEAARPYTPVERFVELRDAGGGSRGGSSRPASSPERAPERAADAPAPRVEPPAAIPLVEIAVGANPTAALSGGSSVSSLNYSPGPGRGRKPGPGDGDGDGPRPGDGLGNNPTGPGVVPPTLVREQKPGYTSAAMRARIQGVAEVEAVVLEDGRVGAVRILKSLDKIHGLDQMALDAAKQFVFRPATDKGKPIRYTVRILLEFTVR
jgi:protein TonB